MRIKINNSLSMKLKRLSALLKLEKRHLLDAMQTMQELASEAWLTLKRCRKSLLVVALILTFLVMCSGCSVKRVAIEPPMSLLIEYSCTTASQTPRDAVSNLLVCSRTNDKHNADKQALRAFFKDME